MKKMSHVRRVRETRGLGRTLERSILGIGGVLGASAAVVVEDRLRTGAISLGELLPFSLIPVMGIGAAARSLGSGDPGGVIIWEAKVRARVPVAGASTPLPMGASIKSSCIVICSISRLSIALAFWP